MGEYEMSSGGATRFAPNASRMAAVNRAEPAQFSLNKYW
jgi:hypothetical protein